MSTQALEREYPRDAAAFIQIGYHDACTNFLVRFHRSDFDVLKRAIVAVGDYNEFDGKRVARALAKIEHLARHISFGREGSPVLYVELDEFEKTTERLAAESATIIAAFKTAKADEHGVQRDGSVRLWWD